MKDALIEFREFADRLIDCLDTVYANDEEAARFLHVGDTFFRKWYKPYCGVKQGHYKTYRQSELLARREQLRSEMSDVVDA